MNVIEAIEKRRSIRLYEDRAVEPEKLHQVLEAMRLAPSAVNAQKWKFFAVSDPVVKEKISWDLMIPGVYRLFHPWVIRQSIRTHVHVRRQKK